MSASTDADSRRAPSRNARERAAAHAEEVGALDRHLVSLLAPASFEAEHYRALRARIELRREEQRLQVIAVTSPGIGEGKTTTAINLAGALAQAREARVLLVDADLRRPSVGAQLGLDVSRTAGLADAIADPDRTLESVILRRLPLNLGILTAGTPSHAPYEALKSSRLATLFGEARRLFDYIIVDTPPLIPVPDCRLITQWVDGLILVVAAHRTPRRLLEEGLNLVEADKVLGLVFNGERRPPAGDYGYGRAYGYTGQLSRRGSRGTAPDARR
jgi:capsular exopolysaccharide synthesis family protein